MVAVVPLHEAVDGASSVAKELAINQAQALVGPAKGSKVVTLERLQGNDMIVHARDELAPAITSTN